jgi:catechol 2,3-dioxygenase-like lactoylglutathione lyase family enzyme
VTSDPQQPAADDAAPNMRRMRLTGLHHVTLIAADLDRSAAFYRDVLGLALVHEGPSDDDPQSRHFWFGDAHGSPGTLISLMEYASLPEGVVGRGSTHHVAFAVESAEEQAAWRDYLRSRGVETTEVFDRGRFRSIYFRDPDGHILEIATQGPGRGGPAAARGLPGSAPA